MILYRVAELIAAKGWTAYRLAQEARLSFPSAYELAKPGAEAKRINGTTLGKLCEVLQVQPGDLLEFVPDRQPSKRRKG